MYYICVKYSNRGRVDDVIVFLVSMLINHNERVVLSDLKKRWNKTKGKIFLILEVFLYDHL